MNIPRCFDGIDLDLLTFAAARLHSQICTGWIRMVCAGVLLISCEMGEALLLDDVGCKSWVCLRFLGITTNFLSCINSCSPLKLPKNLGIFGSSFLDDPTFCRKPCHLDSMSCYCGMEPLNGVPLGWIWAQRWGDHTNRAG